MAGDGAWARSRRRGAAVAQPGPWQPVKQARQARQAQRTVMVGMREWWAYSSLRRLTRSIHRPRTWGGRRGWEGRRWYVCVGWKVEVMRRRTGAAAVAPCRCPASPRLLPENRGAPADPRSPPCNQPAHAVVARSVSHTHTHTHTLPERTLHTHGSRPPPPTFMRAVSRCLDCSGLDMITATCRVSSPCGACRGRWVGVEAQGRGRRRRRRHSSAPTTQHSSAQQRHIVRGPAVRARAGVR